jgi:hypothetical protein
LGTPKRRAEGTRVHDFPPQEDRPQQPQLSPGPDTLSRDSREDPRHSRRFASHTGRNPPLPFKATNAD